MSVENNRLREMLNQVTNNYNALHMHLIAFMRDQKPENTEQGDASNGKLSDDNKQKIGQIVPRQFIDLGLASTNHDTDDNSHSSSEGRSRDRSGSPVNAAEGNRSKDHGSRKNRCGEEINSLMDDDIDNHGKKECGRTRRRENDDSPDHHASPGWSNANKVARFSPSNTSVDQTEATMRKARVSVRARSEAPMASDGYS